MKNMPYATPQTKAIAQKMVQKSAVRSSPLLPLIKYGLIPLGLYFLSQSPVMKTQFRRVHDAVGPALQKANQAIAVTAIQNEESLQELKQAVPIPVAAVPRDSSIPELLPLDLASAVLTKEDLLNDKMNRIPEVFKIPTSQRKRSSFWFDIYTRYSSRFHVIHHVDYPWLIFKVIDTTPLLLGNENRWVKYHRAKSAVDRSVQLVRQELVALAKIKNYSKVTPQQQRYLDLLSEIPGPRKKVLLAAIRNVRSQTGQKDFFKEGIITSGKYIPQMEEIFAQYDLPVELTRLPLVESSFNENATSKVGASGIWQFMPYTGKAYLKINDSIDERNSPLKSSEAAAKYLLMSFRLLKTWPLAITAYNHGPNGVRKAVMKHHTEDLSTLIDNSSRFGFASSNYYASFLAALYAERYQEEAFGQLPKYPAHKVEPIVLASSIRVGTLAAIAGITLEELRLYNKDLKRRSIGANSELPRRYRVFLPQGRKARIELYDFEMRQAATQNKNRRGTKKVASRKRPLQVSFEKRLDEANRM